MRRESADIQYGYVKGFVNLTCEAEAQPSATFKWYRKNKHLHPRNHQIVNGEHISILQVNIIDTKYINLYGRRRRIRIFFQIS